MCDMYHEDRIKQYGYCSLCHATTIAEPAKVEKAKNHKRSD